ncbi:hypothetical protein ACFE04_010155 [Oxalis oulophora]
MCGGPEKSKSSSNSSPTTPRKDMTNLAVGTEDSFSSLLDFASNNDVEGFKKLIDTDLSATDEIGLWYVRQKGSKQIVAEQRTPLMVASMYGSLDVVKLILLHSNADVNLSCGSDLSTALHCAASGGSENAIETVKLLLSAGADPNCVDVIGLRPIDVIVVHPKLQNVISAFENLLRSNMSQNEISLGERNLRVLITKPNSLSSSPENESPHVSSGFDRKEYPIDPSLPDIKNSIYATDEFRMFSFKIRPCSRAYSHDWTECPFVHPGENARRRDPRKFHYSCVPCPDFRKGACRRGDMCEYAHGVFECWLHPAQYRTRLCKDGISCNRRVCFFAHLPEELRPLFVSTGSAVPSPRSSVSVMDMLSLLPGSPSAMSTSPFNQSLSPTGNGNWPQPNIPTLHLPGSNLQSSRLRSSLSARDIHPHDFDFDIHHHFINASPGRMSPRSMDPISPMGVRLSAFAQRGANFAPMTGSPVSSYSKWGSPNGKADWSLQGDETAHMHSFEHGSKCEEPDLSWVQSLVKESPPEMMKAKIPSSVSSEVPPSVGGLNSNSEIDTMDHSVIGAWLEQMQLDQLVV